MLVNSINSTLTYIEFILHRLFHSGIVFDSELIVVPRLNIKQIVGLRLVGLRLYNLEYEVVHS
jgi:hypothetical protein